MYVKNCQKRKKNINKIDIVLKEMGIKLNVDDEKTNNDNNIKNNNVDDTKVKKEKKTKRSISMKTKGSKKK